MTIVTGALADDYLLSADRRNPAHDGEAARIRYFTKRLCRRSRRIFGALVSALVGIPAVGYMISPAMRKNATDVWVPLGPVERLVEGQPKLYTFTRT